MVTGSRKDDGAGRPQIGRYVMGALYVTAGVFHFVNTRRYAAIMPPYLPAHRQLVLLSGLAEIAGGLGVLMPIPVVRRSAAWGLVALLVAVMPANIYMVTDHAKFADIPLWAAWLRLPLQLPLIYWAWRYTFETAGSQEGGVARASMERGRQSSE